MRSRSKHYFLLLSVVFLAITVILGAVLYTRYGSLVFVKKGTVPQADTALFVSTPDQDASEPASPANQPADPASAGDALAPEISGSDVSAPTWMTYNGLDLQRQKLTFYFQMACQPNDIIALPGVMVIPWHSQVLHNGDFSITENTAVAWEHLGYYGLWMHSGVSAGGTPLTAFPLQISLELDDAGGLRSAQAFDIALAECLSGSQVRIEGQDKVTLNRVAAAVRVPASGVEAVSQQSMNLVPYLAETYPDSGFAELNGPALILYFCGRGLSDELYDPKADYFTQSRIIVAITPAE